MMVKNWLENYFQVDLSYFIRGGFWWIFGRISVFLISLALTYFLTNWLTQTDYGTYQYILSAFAIFSIFNLAGIDTSIIKSFAQGKEETFFLAVKTKIKWSFIGSSLAFLISLWYFLHQNFLLGFSFLLIAIFLPFLPTFNLYLSYFQGKKRFDLQSKTLFLARLIPTLMLIPIIIFKQNLILVLTTYFLSQFLVNGLIFLWTKKQIKESETDTEAISFGKHLSLMASLGILGDQIDRIILWQFLGPVSVAIYSLAKITYQRVIELIPIQPLALPKISEKSVAQTKKKILLSSVKLLPFFVLLSLGLILLAPFFYKILFPKYLSAVKYFQIFALALICLPFSLLNTVFITEAKKKELYILSFGSQISKILLFFILIPIYGILGAVLAEVITFGLSNMLLLYFYLKLKFGNISRQE